MNEPSPSEESLRQFLLGKLDDAERERVERLFLTDPQFKDRLLAIEQSLIDDYLEERLAPDKRESFLSVYAASADQRRKLRIVRSIAEHAESSAVLNPVDRPADSKRKGWSRLTANPGLIFSIAAVLLVVIMLALWLQVRRNLPNAQHLAIERELARLNDPSRLRETLPETATLSVAPITLRNVRPQAQFTARADVRVLELHLLLVTNERPAKYRAVLRKGVTSEEFSFPELPAQDDTPRLIRLRVPTPILSPGDYQIRLSSIAVDGTVTAVEEYSFTVSG